MNFKLYVQGFTEKTVTMFRELLNLAMQIEEHIENLRRQLHARSSIPYRELVEVLASGNEEAFKAIQPHF